MLRPDLRLEWLVSFLAVVDSGSFSAAAERTHRSQPRISQHVAALEKEAGLPLFDRRTRPVRLTGAGEALERHARSILDALEEAEADMAERRGAAHGLVTLGSYPSASAAFVPGLLRTFAETHPDVTVVLVELPTLELDQSVRSGEVDLCLRPMAPPPDAETVRMIPLWRERLVVLHPRGHPLAAVPEPLPLDEVTAHPLITIGRLDAAEPLGFESYKVFREHGYELEPVQATNIPQTLVSLVREGLGVGVTNALAAHTSNTDGVVVRDLDVSCGRRVAVCFDAGRRLSPAGRALLDAIRQAPRPPRTTAVEARHSVRHPDSEEGADG